MEISNWYRDNFESQLRGRYITLNHVSSLLESYRLDYEITVVGHSELGREIPMIKMGEGPKTVLGWSQMHGNEATTTKAIFDFMKFISQKAVFQKEINEFLNQYSFFIIPILNPDGAEIYTRENANNVDLNRDAQHLSQKESKCLRKIFDSLQPSLCLNMHDQRSIYGFSTGAPATVSFLSPAANANRTLTESRKVAMREIVKINNLLQKFIPGQVGRFDDNFNEACVGDTFQKAGVPTILFEAGHYGQDYQREKTREFIFYSLLSLFDIIVPENSTTHYESYFDIPENIKNYNDILIRNIQLKFERKPVSIAVQFEEQLEKGRIKFVPVIENVGQLKANFGYKTKDASGLEILTDSQDNLTVGSILSELIDKSS
ncbi:DUF2817 domain-containing protein [Aequorivita sp. SDUM287046]|uniref:DUF2817 domain-containing protein n=1 Tax=Aequorivita aurantiaca TaxID=3053356 RepID=A0ABT8DHI5_9FLAO|nr:M14 family zinc carboxypeptidase [Aequorivita aurantiaca]MDN3723439.1 DUF2817 domain-containing protein [Aequorivita aurantiaca]